MKGSHWSPRDEIGSLTQKFETSYVAEKYSDRQACGDCPTLFSLLIMLFYDKQQT